MTEWRRIATEARTAGFDVQASDLFEAYSTDEEKVEGFDIADYLLIEMPERQNVRTESPCPSCRKPVQIEQGEGWEHRFCSGHYDAWEREPGRRWADTDARIFKKTAA
ncbi:MAG: hypothetical protein IPM66_21625 [Acidobacteriota bacterium]|nr:MAG: hypothetical protein IPM66_21625 [Acidobacteriota bacterium]